MRWFRWLRGPAAVVRWLAMLAACYLGGVAATNLAPTTVETRHYTATLRVAVLPTRQPALHSPTILGDIHLDFLSPLLAPDIDANVSVKENITELFTSRNVSVAALQPSGTEISGAVFDAAVGVGWRFGAGAGTVAVVLSLAVHYARRRRPEGRHLLAVGAAVAVACAGTALGVAWTYQPANFQSYRAGGLLGTVKRNAGMLSGVQARAEQAGPYVKNLLALSQALQEKFVPADLDQAVTARVLLVSDIHGANEYALMRTIVQEAGVDAVVDAGDLLNFGSITEAEASGILEGIASLGVPYLFVAGNHDAASPTDTALLDRLARVPNVVLLQPRGDEYTAYSLNGLRITGFNDPRYFGDDSRNTAAKQAPAVDAFNRAMSGKPVPDIVVAHEPAAAKGVKEAELRVNGHLHTAVLEGSRIGVGTFTGGGTVLHYIESDDGSELTGQPYAFDVATFGGQCRLTTLTRYSYRNLLEGAPVYDNVTVVNGATIERPPAKDAPARTCSPVLGTSRSTVASVPPAGLP